jgi:hypothetical protein
MKRSSNLWSRLTAFSPTPVVANGTISARMRMAPTTEGRVWVAWAVWVASTSRSSLRSSMGAAWAGVSTVIVVSAVVVAAALAARPSVQEADLVEGGMAGGMEVDGVPEGFPHSDSQLVFMMRYDPCLPFSVCLSALQCQFATTTWSDLGQTSLMRV